MSMTSVRRRGRENSIQAPMRVSELPTRSRGGVDVVEAVLERNSSSSTRLASASVDVG